MRSFFIFLLPFLIISDAKASLNDFPVFVKSKFHLESTGGGVTDVELEFELDFELELEEGD